MTAQGIALGKHAEQGSFALKGHNISHSLLRPFRAGGLFGFQTRGGAALCPGLICLGPYGANDLCRYHCRNGTDWFLWIMIIS